MPKNYNRKHKSKLNPTFSHEIITDDRAGIPLHQLLEQSHREQRERRGQQLKSSLSLVKPASAQTSMKTVLPNKIKEPPFKVHLRCIFLILVAHRICQPLSSIMNLPRIMSSPHTADQIAGLWTAYHASLSNGTGRGYLCATIPLDIYKKLEKNGRSYPSFIVPIPRIQPEQETDPSHQVDKNLEREFYFLEWTFHTASPPTILSTSDNPSDSPTSSGSNPQTSVPQTSVILFTPVQEYKTLDTFATPYLILIMYTHLAETHGIVLLRGEITPSAASESTSPYMLSQADAQMLAMTLQKVYLWNENGSDLEKMLHTFHKNPRDFKWQDLLKVIII
jgi:ATP synthase F1 complex assembly factor 1